ncbi:MAG: acyl-CoA dehydrogenase family protein, partial [Hyphomicrobiales bacterium]|nr:acyl-CoA dehydrogenase family protein [Hyphomicrobiales bacterium]
MTYTAPVRDIAHALTSIADLPELIERGICEDLDLDVVDAILEEAGKFAAEQLAPLNRQGDLEGASLENGTVTMPAGWDEVYRQWIEAGWGGLPCPTDHGGQGLPVTLSMAVAEMWQSACMAFSLNTMLTQGAAEALALHGSE